MSDALDVHKQAECSWLWSVATRMGVRKEKKWRRRRGKSLVTVNKKWFPLNTPASEGTWVATHAQFFWKFTALPMCGGQRLVKSTM
jgi:hypothetical protein